MDHLLTYSAMCFLVAFIAAIIAFGGISGVVLAAAALEGVRLLFWVSLVLFGVLLAGGLVHRA
jgi:uncharacterized membrane protein YtjA (UPF0391 family)